MKIVLNELCKAEIKPSFFICHDTSYIIGFYETLLPLPKTYQDKISCIINSVLKQADRTGFYSNEDVAVYYKSVIDYGISHDIEESYIIKLPYRTIDGTLVNEEFLGDGLLHI